jgi:hypothetical protein
LAVAVAATGRFPVKVVADTLGIARSNLVEQLAGKAKPRNSYRRQGDGELLAAIRQLTDARPTYGYRRITALLNRARRASGAEPVNHKRMFRLMAQGKLLLQPHAGHRSVRAHEGRVIAPASNQRWSSDGLENRLLERRRRARRVRHRHVRPGDHRLAGQHGRHQRRDGP